MDLLLFPTPEWFYRYDMVLEFAFAIVTLFVAYFAFSIYRKTAQRFVLFFGIGFSTISLSYFIKSFFNVQIMYWLEMETNYLIAMITIQELNSFSFFAHIFLFTIGLAFLLFTTFKETRLRLLWFLLLVPLSVIFASVNYMYIFYLISSIYLFFISYHYISVYFIKKNPGQLLVALAFLFLFLGHFHFLIAVNHETFYVFGKILEFLAYCFIVGNFYKVYTK